ncbi:hypothetical protein [Primorskyibacter marinus]|uniref:hypothetical protein n=1 Tax=Primorskyibacter marinus TaxID=1977320 RepID=UPI000E30A0D3|nr:hypothetical protein [Primorskyibacter marinus]
MTGALARSFVLLSQDGAAAARRARPLAAILAGGTGHRPFGWMFLQQLVAKSLLVGVALVRPSPRAALAPDLGTGQNAV